jgi:hypothetical protein
MTVQEALENTIAFLESLGYGEGGGVYDDLARAVSIIKAQAPKVAAKEF